MKFSFIATVLPELLNSFKPCDRQSLTSETPLDEVGPIPKYHADPRLRQHSSSAAKSTPPRRVPALQSGGLDAAQPQASNPDAALSCLNREAGMAAVAAELHLQVHA